MYQNQQFECDLNNAYIIVARIVRDFGSAYLPIFKRLKTEIENLKARQSLEDIACQIANTSID